MAEEKKSGEKGFGKYILINELKDKYSNAFSGEESEPKVSNILYLEGIHFNLMYFPVKHLGYKSVINAIADLYARGLKPENLYVNIGLGARFKKKDIELLIEGISLACKKYSISIAELDISTSLTGLAISIASYGRKEKEIKRSQPAATDLLCVTGDLGAAYLGLQILERETKVFEQTGGAQPELKGFEYVIGRQLKPELKYDLLDKVRDAGIKTGIIRTVRDGLASEILHIANDTGLGCRIYHDKLSIDRETEAASKELGFETIISALNGGDDFEYVITVPVKQHELIEKIEGISIIGHHVPKEEGNSLALQDGSLAELKAQGWE